MVDQALSRDGYHVFAHDPAVAEWACAARKAAGQVLAQGAERRHGKTWFVGVDALPNAPDGSIGGAPLGGAWRDYVAVADIWHPAQLSVVFAGYPQRDAGESEAAHRYRRDRDAAHVDGLLPEGPQRRRHLREPHGFILGLPLDDVVESPLVVWRGSHVMMRHAFAQAFHGSDPSQWGDVDVTDIYQQARRKMFECCERLPLPAGPGQAILLDRHLLHGVAPWQGSTAAQMRMTAYFRPQVSVAAWL